MFQAAQDTHRGVMDRLRTLRMSRAAVPLGQAVADLVVTAAGTVPFLLVGLAMGWRIEESALAGAGAAAYIPTGNLPDWLRTLAEWNPISAVTTALRDLFGNAPVPGGAAWPVAHPVAGSPAWRVVLLAVFAPLAVHRSARGER